MIDVTGLTSVELDQLLSAVFTERNRRKTLAEAAALQQDISLANMAAEGHVDGEPWVRPNSAESAYPAQWRVSHLDKSWRSSVPGNVWEPGVSGWVEETGQAREWVQPVGKQDAFRLGDLVTMDGLRTFKSVIDWNIWHPMVTGWEEVLPDQPEDVVLETEVP